MGRRTEQIHHLRRYTYEKESYEKVLNILSDSSVQSLSRVRLFATPWTAARQASLSITNSWGSPKLMSIESVMPSNHLILCRSLLLLPSIFPSIKVFSNESALRIRWPKYWSFSFNISPSNEHPGLISREMQIIIKWVNHYIFTRVLKIKMSDPTYQGWMSGKQLEFSYTADGECKWYNHFGKESGRFLKS